MIASFFELLRTYWRILVGIAILKWMAFHFWLLNTWFGIDSTEALWDSAITSIVITGLSLILISTLLNYVPQMGKFWFALAISFALAWLSGWIINSALAGITTEGSTYVYFLERSSPVRIAFAFIAIAGVSISSLFYQQLHEQQELAARNSATSTMLKEAELQKLQLQLQPHFLFNCLNSINALIIVNPEEARRMVQHLSDFLRATIKRSDEHWISFEEEWNYIELYLSIEKVRFGHRLNIDSNLAEGVRDWRMPTLLLQPLIENAIKFGLYGTTDTITIRVDANTESNYLVLVITNPFDEDSRPQKGSGFGLSGLKRRLYLLFARNDLLQTKTEENVFTVTLKLPKHND